MKVVWKFPMYSGTCDFEIQMPTGSTVLRVAMHDERPHLWALVDPNQPKERRGFIVRATGAWVEDDYIYIGTYIEVSGELEFVRHVFSRE